MDTVMLKSQNSDGKAFLCISIMLLMKKKKIFLLASGGCNTPHTPKAATICNLFLIATSVRKDILPDIVQTKIHTGIFSVYLRGRLWAPVPMQNILIFPYLTQKNSQLESKL